MRYSTYKSIYESVYTKTSESRTIYVKEQFLQRLKTPTWLLKIVIITLIIIIGCSAVFTVFAGDEQLLSGDRIVVSQGDTLWGISLAHKPQQMDTRVYVEAIKKVNKLEHNAIRIGEVLVLPGFDQ
ncbi:LysM peptidoglycan-binding domain-containing protein [Paenibacillus sp. 1781tsa1]|uniref:LysM peptidoglycan-binding domain-containing protein n=1 Tax=Paenibacillus sp. 1781tsa1 TaxID=2953810 RepID=UPI00209FAB49|nr:LysM peptidoglycan-binding domain-containing protein [Paenibacillus sp. 1781tsa1]MCP1187407.1 LysM peptidoglycan-binding domain-containing protein [Paenibacillus sp. 1781tsa1]